MLQSTSNQASSAAARIAVAITEWEATERLVSELNKRVDHQRQLIEQLARQGHEIISAEIVLESLIASLSLAGDHWHRLCAILNTKPRW
jgi:hypothetical protein